MPPERGQAQDHGEGKIGDDTGAGLGGVAALGEQEHDHGWPAEAGDPAAETTDGADADTEGLGDFAFVAPARRDQHRKQDDDCRNEAAGRLRIEYRQRPGADRNGDAGSDAKRCQTPPIRFPDGGARQLQDARYFDQ